MDFLEMMNKFKKEETKGVVYCPTCREPMIKRASRPGLKSKFWYGCSNYPLCRSIILDINLKDKHYKR